MEDFHNPWSSSPEFILPGDPPDIKPDPGLLVCSEDPVDCTGAATFPHIPDDPLEIKPDPELRGDVKEEVSEGGSAEEGSHSDGTLIRWDHEYACPKQSDLERHVQYDTELAADKLEGRPTQPTQDDTTHKCDSCGKVFTHWGTFNAHTQTCVVEQNELQSSRVYTVKRLFSCGICGKLFATKGNLATHSRLHTGRSPLSCDVCGKGFLFPSELVRHLQVHTGERPCSCDVCGKAFAYKSVLAIHLRVHTGERPFSCDVCGKPFPSKSGLICHSRVHTAERPFSCDVCGKMFSQKGSLFRHSRVHTGERPFSCDMW